MYIYFDRYGKLKEIIDDGAIRVGDYGSDKVYIYFESEEVITDYLWRMKVGSTVTNEYSFKNNVTAPMQIPYEIISKIDTKYFKQYQDYVFHYVDFKVNGSYVTFTENGQGLLTIRLMNNSTIKALGEITFNVEDNVLDEGIDITQSQYDYLLTRIVAIEQLTTDTLNYLELSGTSGTLEDDELADILSKKITFIKRGNEYYYYNYSDASSLYFQQLTSMVVSSTNQYTIGNKKIVIDNSTGAWDLATMSSVFYNKTYIDNLVTTLQPKIDNDHKLSSGLVDDENKVNRFTRFLALLSETGTITEQNQSSINQAGLILVYPLHNPSYFRFLKQDDTYYYYAKTPELTKSTANDSLSLQYIRINKSTYAYEVVTVTDDFYNKAQLDGKGFITKAVNDLTNYYTKTTSDGKYALITEAGNKIVLEIDSSTFKIKAKLYDKNNALISTSNEIDLPLESVVVSGSYDSATKKVILTLQNGSTIEFSVADLISGLQPTIDSSHKLSADLVDDTNTTNKFVTAGDKATWNSKANGKRFIDLSTYEFSTDLSLTTLLTAIENIVGTLEVGTTYGFSVAFEDLIANMQILDGGTGYNSYWTIITRAMELSISGTGALSTIINNKTLGDMTTLLFATVDQLDDYYTKVQIDSNLVVVELTGTGGTLNGAQYNLVANAKSCVILIGGAYYHKHLEDSSSITYQRKTQTDLGTSVMLSEGKITINKSTKVWGIDSASAEVWKRGQVYSKSEVNALTDKSLYHLGAFDTVATANGITTITRQTGYADLSKLNWIGGSGNVFSDDLIGLIETSAYGVTPSMVSQNYEVVPTTASDKNGKLSLGYTNASKPARLFYYTNDPTFIPKGLLQFKLPTPYTEQVIADRPLNTLDQNGSQWLRNEWEKGLNLLNPISKKFINAYNLCIGKVNLQANKTYTFALPSNVGISPSIRVYRRDMDGLSNETLIGTTSNYILTFTADVSGEYQLWLNPSNATTAWLDYEFIINEGNHPYPYQAYNGAIIHEKDLEPTLLWKNASPSADFATGEVLSNVSQLPYKYLVFEFAIVKDNLAITEMVKIKLNNLTLNGDFAYSKYVNLETDTITRNVAFISSDNKIYVSDATDTSNNTVNNYLIPVAIYGTNVL